MYIFRIKDKSGRYLYLSHERWSHICKEHPEISSYIEELKINLENPDKIKTYEYDEQIRYYYNYIKYRESPAKYLLVIVKYLNGEGFIITAYFVRYIK